MVQCFHNMHKALESMSNMLEQTLHIFLLIQIYIVLWSIYVCDTEVAFLRSKMKMTTALT